MVRCNCFIFRMFTYSTKKNKKTNNKCLTGCHYEHGHSGGRATRLSRSSGREQEVSNHPQSRVFKLQPLVAFHQRQSSGHSADGSQTVLVQKRANLHCYILSVIFFLCSKSSNTLMLEINILVKTLKRIKQYYVSHHYKINLHLHFSYIKDDKYTKILYKAMQNNETVSNH